MRSSIKMLIVFSSILFVSFMLMYTIHVEYNDIGIAIARNWCSTRNESSTDPLLCLNMLNSRSFIILQTLALALFLLVIALIVIKTEWRTGAAILCLVPLLITGSIPPQYLIEAVSWNLILFLIGSMTLAGILKEIGVFRYIAIRILEVTKGRTIFILVMIAVIAFALSATLDEATSVVYVAMLVIELSRLIEVNPVPLLIFSVLATNTGSVALPIGNPIGVYLLFETNMRISRFITRALPLAVLNLVVLILSIIYLKKSLVREIDVRVKKFCEKIEAFIIKYRIELSGDHAVFNRLKRVKIGLVLLFLFILTIVFNDVITHEMSAIYKIQVDPHSFLSFIPYIYITLSLLLVLPLEDAPKFIEKSVEWSSLVFFMFLFMFSYVLSYTGVMAKLAYAFTHLSSASTVLLPIMLFSSAILSSFLDNLSVIVTFTPVAMIFNNIGLINDSIYFVLLYGGVFGGNYTPIGSTANIIAISMAEKRKIKIKWSTWLKISLATTTLQLIIAFLWLLTH